MAKKQNPQLVASIPVPATEQTQQQQVFEKKKETDGAKSEALDLTTPSDSKKKLQLLILDAFKNKSHHMSIKLPYKNLKLYTANKNIKKRWYIEYYYLYPGSVHQYKRFKEYLGINKVKDLSDRILYGSVALKFIADKLAKGFNPFTAERRADASSQPFLGIQEQLKHIIELMSINASKSQLNSYQEMYNRLMLYCEYFSLLHTSMFDFSLGDAKKFKDWMLYERDLSAKTVNNTISHLSMFWDRAIEEQLTEQNPFKLVTKAKLRDKPVDPDADIRFEPLTDAEMIKIFAELRAAGEFNFIRFALFIYYAWARPVEILRLTVADIELERSLIRFKQGKTKNGKASYVQIVPPLMEKIKELHLEKYPGHYYIFSDNYLPGERMLSKNNPSAQWREKVKNKIGIKKDLYALKHTGNIEYLINNKGMNNLKWQQLQNRHSSAVITETYNKRIGAYFIDVENLKFRLC